MLTSLDHAEQKAPVRRGQVLVAKTIDQTIEAGPAKSRKSSRDGGIWRARRRQPPVPGSARQAERRRRRRRSSTRDPL